MFMTKYLRPTILSSLVVALVACSDDGGGECTGDITRCPLPDLSSEQQGAFCDTLLAAIDDSPGTRYECADTGLYLEVNTRTECAATEYGADCPVTGAETIACYKAAKIDACAAFDESGACGDLFAAGEACAA